MVSAEDAETADELALAAVDEVAELMLATEDDVWAEAWESAFASPGSPVHPWPGTAMSNAYTYLWSASSHASNFPWTHIECEVAQRRAVPNSFIGVVDGKLQARSVAIGVMTNNAFANLVGMV